MIRREFIKKTLFSSFLIFARPNLIKSNKAANNEAIGKWTIRTIEQVLHGIKTGNFYYVYFTNFITEDEPNQMFNTKELSLVKPNYITYHIRNFVKLFTKSLLTENKTNNLIFIKQSESKKHLLNNSYRIYLKERAKYFKKMITKNKAIIYIYDKCEYEDVEPYALRDFFREEEQIQTNIIHFAFKEVWISYDN